MKATINVKKGSAVAQHNGKTVEVETSKIYAMRGKLMFALKGLDDLYPNNYIDFSQDELIFS